MQFARKRRLAALLLCTAAAASTIAIAPAASAADFSIARTQIGIYPRSAPSMDAEQVGDALSDGVRVSVQCEATGQVVSNGYQETNIWEQLTDGTYLPNAFMDTGSLGWTPGVPVCGELPVTAPAEEVPKEYAGAWIPDDRVSLRLLNHYYEATGDEVVVDWAFFARSQRLVEDLKSLPEPNGFKVYQSNPWDDGDIYWTGGAFTIARTSPHCYAIVDKYDFAPDKPENLPYILNWVDARRGEAKEFTVHASGCVY